MADEMTYEAMLQLLSEGGVDVENFDRDSRKTLRQLYEEIQSKDVVLFRDKQTGRIRRVALSVKIHIRTKGFALYEMSRTYRDGTTLEQPKEWSISETRKRGESVTEAALRGLKEECNLTVTAEELEIEKLAAPDRIDIHESTAYKGLQSCVLTQDVGLTLPRQLWRDGLTIEDNGMKVFLAWVPDSSLLR